MKKYIERAICLMLCVCILSGLTCCTTSYNEKTIYALDTYITLKTDKKISGDVDAFIARYENELSYTREGSYIYNINHNISNECSEELAELIETAMEISRETDGAFDITCGALKELWRLDTDSPHIPTTTELFEALKNVGWKKISISDDRLVQKNDGLLLDLGGIAKGYIAQKTVQYLREDGIEEGIASFGGNIAIIGKKKNGAAWCVGLKDPTDTSRIFATLEVYDGFISTSGEYERYSEIDGVKYHHIFDTKSGCPSESGLTSVSVVCSDGTLADALSTALFVMGIDKITELYNGKKYDFEAVCVSEDGKIYVSQGLRESFKAKNGNTAVEYFGDQI